MNTNIDKDLLVLARTAGIIQGELTRTDEIMDHIMLGVMSCILGTILICTGYVVYQAL